MPLPPPASVTVNVKFVVLLVKFAVTLVAPEIVKVHTEVPSQGPAPVQPEKVEPAAAVAVSAITWPLAKFAVQVGWHAIPAGLLITVPLPVPISVMVKAAFADLLNVAVTACAAVMVTEHPAVPLQPAPLQPAKVEPAAAVAVSATTCPLAKFAVQVG